MRSDWVDAITKTVSSWVFHYFVYIYFKECSRTTTFNLNITLYRITFQLPPPPQIELVVDKPHLMNVLRRPLVRIRRKFHPLF